jgi:hypothetical protein
MMRRVRSLRCERCDGWVDGMSHVALVYFTALTSPSIILPFILSSATVIDLLPVWLLVRPRRLASPVICLMGASVAIADKCLGIDAIRHVISRGFSWRFPTKEAYLSALLSG